MPERWTLKSDGFAYPASEENGGIQDIIHRLLALRGVVDEEERARFLAPDYDMHFHDPFLFSSMRKVMDRLALARESGERVGVFGDFDADGVTSSVLLREGLEALGIPVSVYIPHKETEGHGLHVNALDAFDAEGVKLFFTVDCGMMSHEEIAEANRRGMQVIVIDHHHVPEVLPDAYAIVNPKLRGERYPFKELCGAGTTFKVLQAIYETFLPEKKGELKWRLDAAAIGTVADVMPLIGENRLIVTYGLIVLAKTRRVGLQELYSVGKLPFGAGKPPIARDIAFHIAPRLNAAGRMAHAKLSHDLLVEEDTERAREFATRLERHNIDRRKVSDDMAKTVSALAAAKPDRKLIFAAHPDFHLGVVGLVAGKVAREFGKPAIVLTVGETESRGSLRSIPGFSIIEAISECDDILLRFGGHDQAAGLSIRNEHLPAFEKRLEAIVERNLRDIRTEPELLYDMTIDSAHLTLDFSRELARFAPFGEGNPEPIFLLEDAVVDEVRVVGSDKKHLKLRLRAGGRVFDAIGFSLAKVFGDLASGERIDAMIGVNENEWNGSVTLQLKVYDMRRRENAV
jgi:single-stranded-DNA-specific exonuclease